MAEKKVVKEITKDEKFDRLIENHEKMSLIVRQMREIPVLPSEKPEDVTVLSKVEFPDEGGVLTYMEGHPVPFRGFPYFEFVDGIDKVKKLLKAQLSGIYHNIYKGNKIKLLLLLPAFWTLKRIVRIEVYTFYRMIERFRLKPEIYCQAMREFYRVFSIDRESESLQDRELRLMVRDLMCMILEFDNAYRYRLQDIMEELNQEEIRKNPAKELKRIISIASSREKTQNIKDMWTLMEKLLVNYLRIDRKFGKMLFNVLSEINKDEVKLDDSDKHFSAGRKDYIFGFQLRGEKAV